jgi:hypothetical protein
MIVVIMNMMKIKKLRCLKSKVRVSLLPNDNTTGEVRVPAPYRTNLTTAAVTTGNLDGASAVAGALEFCLPLFYHSSSNQLSCSS